MTPAFRLLLTRRLGPFFFTQLTGAYNDNFFRSALVALITYRITQVGGFGPEELVAASAGIFLLPFLLFSAIGGQLADHFPRDGLIRHIKLAESVIMALTWIGFATGSVPLLFSILFLTGVQSALFGPVKHAILPNLLARPELLAGNAWVAGGTFIAILAGSPHRHLGHEPGRCRRVGARRAPGQCPRRVAVEFPYSATAPRTA